MLIGTTSSCRFRLEVFRNQLEVTLDTTKVTRLAKEMAAFSRQAVEQAQKVSQSPMPQILAAVTLLLAAGITPDHSSYWDGRE
jgi:hypothetical protein